MIADGVRKLRKMTMKQHRKLITAILLLMTAMVMVVSVSYAWVTMSASPVVQNIQITIAGSHTVLVAPDISMVNDGNIVHYPGAFHDSILFSRHEQYRYLQNMGGLLPVSTADGLNWYVPRYYEKGDPEVQRGQAFAGQIRPTAEFLNDTRLDFANLSSAQAEEGTMGNYVCLDFWIVAPVDGYKIRVSTGDEMNGGSFVIDLLEPEKNTENGMAVYTLTKENSQAAACVRVGFLVNEDIAGDEAMLQYSRSEGFNSSYDRLRGVYSEQGLSYLNSINNRFTIYEPNATLHPTEVKDTFGNPVRDGSYAVTEPLGLGGVAVSVRERLTAQLTNEWVMLGEERYIQQAFQAAFPQQNLLLDSAQTLKKKFYIDTLQYNLYPYVNKGQFFDNTSMLYAAAGSDKLAESQTLTGLMRDGATDDVYITQLEGSVPQRVRMFVWLEGQDVDCINAAATSGFAISIELAASNVA